MSNIGKMLVVALALSASALLSGAARAQTCFPLGPSASGSGDVTDCNAAVAGSLARTAAESATIVKLSCPALPEARIRRACAAHGMVPDFLGFPPQISAPAPNYRAQRTSSGQCTAFREVSRKQTLGVGTCGPGPGAGPKRVIVTVSATCSVACRRSFAP